MLPDEVREAVEVSTSPRVDELIERVMQKHPGFGASAQARYYEAVHQELAPLARDLEARAERADALLRECKTFLEEMHVMNVDWTIAESQTMHKHITAHLSENSRDA